MWSKDGRLSEGREMSVFARGVCFPSEPYEVADLGPASVSATASVTPRPDGPALTLSAPYRAAWDYACRVVGTRYRAAWGAFVRRSARLAPMVRVYGSCRCSPKASGRR